MNRLTTPDLELKACQECEKKGMCYAKGWCVEKRKAITKLSEYEQMDKQGQMFKAIIENENVENTELRKSFVNTIIDNILFLNNITKTDAESELVLLIAETVKENIEFIPYTQEEVE